MRRWEGFLKGAVSRVRGGARRSEIRRELTQHLEETFARLRAEGWGEDAAADEALRRMGDAAALARRLGEVHSPRPDPMVWAPALLLVLCGTGLLAPLGRAPAHAIFALLGALAGLGLYYRAPRLTARRAVGVYALTWLLVALAAFLGPWSDGQPYLPLGPLRVKIVDVAPYLFIVAAAGLRGTASLLTLVPLALFAATGALPSLVLYALGWLALKREGRVLFAIAFSLAAVSIPGTIPKPPPPGAVEWHTDYVLALALERVGRPLGAVIVALSLILWGRLASRVIRFVDEPERALGAGLVALVGGELAWALVANLGWLPVPPAGLNFPLVSFGGSLMLVHLSAVGYLLGRRVRQTA
jgi:hypothetical protein